MKLNLFVILFYAFSPVLLSSQTDSSLVANDTVLLDGIFITYHDFRYNHPIIKEKLISSISKDQLDFIGKSLEKETFSYKADQNVFTINSKAVWGFFQNKTLYVNYKGNFYRVPVFGAICYLVATVEVMGSGFYDPMFGPGMGSTARRQEVREFLINYYNGIITEFKTDYAELLISRDKELYAEFKKLSRKKQRDQISRYIRKYNENNPIYFLKE